jgi:hypothetical protein
LLRSIRRSTCLERHKGKLRSWRFKRNILSYECSLEGYCRAMMFAICVIEEINLGLNKMPANFNNTRQTFREAFSMLDFIVVVG